MFYSIGHFVFTLLSHCDYLHLFSQAASFSGAAECGNGLCEVGENSVSCSSDCIGPAFEFGASILAGAYEEDYVLCDAFFQCQDGYRRNFIGSMHLDFIEIRYFGQNNLRAGIELRGLSDKGVNVSVSNIAMNRGYYWAIDIQSSNKVKIDGNVLFRSHLPALRIENGVQNIISNNLATVGIFWNTHRGAKQVILRLYSCLPSFWTILFKSYVL